MSRNTIRIGGDASGPVVAGDGSRVEVRHAPADPAPADTASADNGAADTALADTAPTQNNTAKGHGTLFAVLEGDVHVHHEATGPTGPTGTAGTSAASGASEED
ncbi:hypothetical protein [Streptomyces sp. NPDC014734]|uniref:hypothetical protein n=1 Tax=Streptomyces sp. NPDC014734 TaxID=3364886 RepID=UPI0037001725